MSEATTTRRPRPRPRHQRLVDRWAERTVGAAYRKGTRRTCSRYDDEIVDPLLVCEGERLRSAVLREAAGAYARDKHSVLFITPGAKLGGAWTRGLVSCLRHAGVRCSIVGSGSPRLAVTLEVARPTVIVTRDSPESPTLADRAAIGGYRRANVCVHLVLAAAPYPHCWREGRRLSAEDESRLRWAAGEDGPDGLLSFFSEEYYETLMPEWAAAGVPFLSLPAACDPLVHYPRRGVRDLDFFMVATREPDRVWVVRDYLRPIFREYRGTWAGGGWSFGEAPLDPAMLGDAYARARIALNPLHRELVEHPMEVSERTFSAAACGAFVLTDRTPLGERFFATDEVVMVDGRQEFQEAFRYYVARPAERERMALKAMTRVFSQHTYLRRGATLLDFVSALRH